MNQQTLNVVTVSAFFLFISSFTNAQKLQADLLKKVIPSFVENKGQVVDQYGNPRQDVKYLMDNHGLKLILKENSFSYELYILEKQAQQISEATGKPSNEHRLDQFNEPGPVTIKTSRVDIELKGANPHPQIIAEGRSEHYVNYYKEYTGEKGITDIYYYNKVTYRNIYKNIDIEFYTTKDGLPKYDIIVRPGGKLSDVRMVYKGLQSMRAEQSRLYLQTALGAFEETIPFSYQEESGATIAVGYAVEANTITFDAEYDKNETLVIDPVVRDWATYYGGSIFDKANSNAIDGNGDAYITGPTFSTSGIATTGAHQTSRAGGYDVFIAKFNNSGILQWGTYYGGSSGDEAKSIAIDGSSNAYIAGETQSTSGIATTGAHQTVWAGDFDAFIAKFNSSGTLQWGTYFGGSNEDRANSIAIDGSGYPFIAGYTPSTSGIATTGAHQTAGAGGDDAFIVKFNSSGTLQWGTYYGGSKNDVAYGIAIDSSGNAFITGFASSTSGIATTGTHQTTLSGTSDAFIAKFNSSGTLQWGTYYGGSSSEAAYSIAIDGSGNTYITGYTPSTSGIATTGAQQTSVAGSKDAFIAKFNSSGTLQWGTYYGGSSSEAAYSIAIDGSGNAYITGYTTSTSGIATTGAYQTTVAGSNDAFIAIFNSSGTLKWGTYYGGSNRDYIHGIAIDGSGNAYFSGYTTSTSGIATTGAHQTSLAGDNDAFLLKIINQKLDAGVLQLVEPLNDFCPANHNVLVKFKNYGSATITSITINWSVNGVVQSPYSWTGSLDVSDTSSAVTLDNFSFAAGTHTIKVWTSKPNAKVDEDNKNDTLPSIITVFPLPAVSFTVSDACMGEAVSFNNNSSVSSGTISNYLWKFGDSTTSSDVTPTKAYSKAGIYTIWLIATTNNGCKDSTGKSIIIYPRASVSFTASNSCTGEAVSFINNSSISNDTISSYLWDFGDNTTTDEESPIHVFSIPGKFVISLTALTGSGCEAIHYDTITIWPVPVVQFIADNACLGDSIKFTDNTSIDSTSGISTIGWDFGDGTNGIGAAVSHLYADTGKYTVKQVVTTVSGCIDSVVKEVTVFANPIAGFDYTVNERKVTFKPKNTTPAKYEWDFGDGATSNESDPIYTYEKDGYFFVSLKVINNNGCSSTYSDSIRIKSTDISSVEKPSIRVTLYPNPFQEQLNIHYHLNKNATVTIELYDIHGKRVTTLLQNVVQQADEYTYSVNPNDYELTSGVYFIRIILNDSVITKQAVSVR